MAADSFTPLSPSAALSRVGRALGNPLRVEILLALRESPAYPGDLAVALHASAPVLRRHLACLRSCGLIDAVADQNDYWYRLADQHLYGALDELARVVLYVGDGPDDCEEF